MTLRRQLQKHLNFAQGYIMLQMYEDAIVELDHALALVPDSLDALYWKGVICLERKQLREAEKLLRHIVTKDPNQAHVYIHLAYIYRRTISLEKAIETIQKALKLSPTLAVAIYNLACYKALQGKAQESLKLLQRAIRLDKEYSALARADPDFDSVRHTNLFQKLITKKTGESETK